MKKILYITPYYKPSWFYGGPPKCIAEQAEYLVSKYNYQIDVITLNKNGEVRLFESDAPVVKNINEITVHYLPASESKLGKAYFSSPELKSYLKQFSDYDLVHIHMLFNAFSTAGAQFAIQNKIPFGYSVHGMLDRFSLTRSKWMKKIHRYFYEDKFLKKAAFVHFTTENEKKNAIYPTGIKPVIIPIGVVFEPYQDFPAVYAYEDLRMIYLSRINRKKGLDKLIKAISQISGNIRDRLCLDIYGEDDDHFLPELKSIVETNQLKHLVKFKGKLDPSERNKILQTYDLLVLTSFQENFGLAVAEALDQKIPVLISDKVNLADQIEEHQCGWVTTLKESAITKKIEEAFRTPKHIRKQMGEKGHKYVRDSYSFETVGKAYNELYDRIMIKN